jgi:hypothetical protein
VLAKTLSLAEKLLHNLLVYPQIPRDFLDPRCFGAAMTLAEMGYHFQVMTRKLLDAVEEPILRQAFEKGLTEEAD